MINNNRPIRQLLGWLIIGTKGGKTRSQIIKTLKKSPQNSNQLATLLKVNYSTAYFLSELMEENYGLFEEITSKMNDTKKRAIRVTQK